MATAAEKIHSEMQSSLAAARATPEYAQEGRELMKLWTVENDRWVVSPSGFSYEMPRAQMAKDLCREINGSNGAGGTAAIRTAAKTLLDVLGRALNWKAPLPNKSHTRDLMEAAMGLDQALQMSAAGQALVKRYERMDRALNHVSVDPQSLGGMKISWREDDGRLYAYDKDGKFLWSGDPGFSVWQAVRMSERITRFRTALTTMHGLVESAVNAFKGKLPNPDIAERDLAGEALAADLLAKADKAKGEVR